MPLEAVAPLREVCQVGDGVRHDGAGRRPGVRGEDTEHGEPTRRPADEHGAVGRGPALRLRMPQHRGDVVDVELTPSSTQCLLIHPSVPGGAPVVRHDDVPSP